MRWFYELVLVCFGVVTAYAAYVLVLSVFEGKDVESIGIFSFVALIAGLITFLAYRLYRSTPPER